MIFDVSTSQFDGIPLMQFCDSSIWQVYGLAVCRCGGFAILHYCDFHMFSFCEFVILWFTDIPIVATLQFFEVKISPLYVLVTSMFWDFLKLHYSDLASCFSIMQFCDFPIIQFEIASVVTRVVNTIRVLWKARFRQKFFTPGRVKFTYRL